MSTPFAFLWGGSEPGPPSRKPEPIRIPSSPYEEEGGAHRSNLMGGRQTGITNWRKGLRREEIKRGNVLNPGPDKRMNVTDSFRLLTHKDCQEGPR